MTVRTTTDNHRMRDRLRGPLLFVPTVGGSFALALSLPAVGAALVTASAVGALLIQVTKGGSRPSDSSH